MSKIFKALEAIRLLARHPWMLNKILDDDMQWQKRVSGKYGMDNGLPVVGLNQLFEDLDGTVYPYASLDGSSLPTDMALLRNIARSFKDCAYFEIGTWRGESVANVAAVAGDCVTLNLSEKEMQALGLSQKYIGLHRHYSAILPNVTHLEGDSRTFDFASLSRKFDLIFIDGDHHYDLVKNDTEKVFKHLVKEGSVVVWHDYAYNPERPRFEVMAGILDGSPSDRHSHIYHVANTMCAIYIEKDIPSREFTSPQKPEGAFEISLKWRPEE